MERGTDSTNRSTDRTEGSRGHQRSNALSSINDSSDQNIYRAVHEQTTSQSQAQLTPLVLVDGDRSHISLLSNTSAQWNHLQPTGQGEDQPNVPGSTWSRRSPHQTDFNPNQYSGGYHPEWFQDPSRARVQWGSILNGFELSTHSLDARSANEVNVSAFRSTDASPPRPGATSEPAPITTLDVSQFPNVAKQILHRIDPTGQGVTKEQLAKALADPQFAGHEAQALVAMYNHFDSLSSLSWDRGDKLSTADIAAFAQGQRLQSERFNSAENFSLWARDHLRRFTEQTGGVLTRQGITQALTRSDLSSDDRQNLEYARDHYGQIHRGLPISQSDAVRHMSHLYRNTSEAQLEERIANSLLRVTNSQRQPRSLDLYGFGGDPTLAIGPNGVVQGYVGDCYFHSFLASVAHTQPELIRNAIKENLDGSFTVTFPGARNEPITVGRPTQAELALYTQVNEHGIWPAIMQKALGEYASRHFWRRSPANLSGGNTPQEGLEGGSATSTTLDLLTGSSSNGRFIDLHSRATILHDLESALTSNPPRAVAVGTNGSLLSLLVSNETADGFLRAHQYSVIGFSREGSGGGTVTVRDPHGGANAVRQISVDQFMRNFFVMFVQDPPRYY